MSSECIVQCLVLEVFSGSFENKETKEKIPYTVYTIHVKGMRGSMRVKVYEEKREDIKAHSRALISLSQIKAYQGKNGVGIDYIGEVLCALKEGTDYIGQIVNKVVPSSRAS